MAWCLVEGRVKMAAVPRHESLGNYCLTNLGAVARYRKNVELEV